jgi:hypothetical protein
VIIFGIVMVPEKVNNLIKMVKTILRHVAIRTKVIRTKHFRTKPAAPTDLIVLVLHALIQSEGDVRLLRERLGR